MTRSRHKGVADPLVPVAERRWLVVRDACRRVVDCTELEPWTDLRAALNAERDRRLAQGWGGCEIPVRCAFFFCERIGERLFVGIEGYLPGTQPVR